jgi:hypothetical protein
MFRFTIRDIFWLMALVAMGASWYHQSTIWESEKQTLIDAHTAALANERRIGDMRAKEAAEQVRARFTTPRGVPAVPAEQIRAYRSRLRDEALTPAIPLT